MKRLPKSADPPARKRIVDTGSGTAVVFFIVNVVYPESEDRTNPLPSILYQ